MIRVVLLSFALAACALAASTCPAQVQPASQMVVTWDGIEVDGIALSCVPTGRPVPVAWDTTLQHLAWTSIEPPLIRLRPDLAGCSCSPCSTTAEMRNILADSDWEVVRAHVERDPRGQERWARMQACRWLQ